MTDTKHRLNDPAGKNGVGVLAAIVLATALVWGVAACLLAMPITLDGAVLLR